MEFKYKFINYWTNLYYKLLRHLNAKYKCQIIENNSEKMTGQNVIPSGENVTPSGENVTPSGENVTPNGQNVIPNQNICKKCNKIYKTKNSLIENEKNIKVIIKSTFH